jgi:sugar lactone lactonase YvrE
MQKGVKKIKKLLYLRCGLNLFDTIPPMYKLQLMEYNPMHYYRSHLFTYPIIPVLTLIFSFTALAHDVHEAPPLPRATITPTRIDMEPGEKQWFKVIQEMTRLNSSVHLEDVEWSVNNIPGGNKDIGTIDKKGKYTAPAKTPSPREVIICAKAKNVENPYLWATVQFKGEGAPYKMIMNWGESIENAKHFKDPHCIALDPDGNIIIADYDGSKVHRWTPDGEFIGYLGTSGEGPGQVTKPRVVTTGPDNLLYVSDQKSDKPRIQVFDNDGNFVRIFAAKGTGPGHILRAHGLAFDPEGNLYVVDVDNMRINSYTREGAFLNSWGRDGRLRGEFNAPHGLVMDKNGDAFVSGYYGTCQKFNRRGEYLFQFAEGNPPDGAVYIHSASGDKYGNVYLMVRGMKGYGGAIQEKDHIPSILKFNNNGDHVASITLEVSGHKENWATIDDEGNIYAIFKSSEGYGVQVYAPR